MFRVYWLTLCGVVFNGIFARRQHSQVFALVRSSEYHFIDTIVSPSLRYAARTMLSICYKWIYQYQYIMQMCEDEILGRALQPNIITYCARRHVAVNKDLYFRFFPVVSHLVILFCGLFPFIAQVDERLWMHNIRILVWLIDSPNCVYINLSLVSISLFNQSRASIRHNLSFDYNSCV